MNRPAVDCSLLKGLKLLHIGCVCHLKKLFWGFPHKTKLFRSMCCWTSSAIVLFIPIGYNSGQARAHDVSHYTGLCCSPLKWISPGGSVHKPGWIIYCHGCHVCDPQHRGKSLSLEHNSISSLSFIATLDEVWKMLNNWSLIRKYKEELLYAVTRLEFERAWNQVIAHLLAFMSVHILTNSPS